ITATDLANHQSANSAFLAADIRKAKSVDDLVAVSQRLPSLHLRLSTAGVTARHVGEAVSSITDSITLRLIEMAEAEFGEAPVPYVWMAGGSQGRHEQSSHSDQDNALLISDDYQPEHEDYFAKLAHFVCDGLNACGFIYCPGEAMAANPQWRKPLKNWKEYFHGWIDSPEPMALMLSSIWFDLRPVGGQTHLFDQLHAEILSRTADNGIFLAYMAANAMQHRPPLGFFRSFVLEHGGDHDDTLDLKHRGIVPITDLARVMALAQGVSAVNTSERLAAVSGTPAMSREMGENLEDALEFIASLRIRHQADQIRREQKADNYLDPDDLSQLERDHLKDAFKIIQTMQESMVKRYQAERLG
ncbi:MAG: putative nucleotidyltransferase substrate binding domain-containing protein, partial [Gammaproteobacteria bacterium]